MSILDRLNETYEWLVSGKTTVLNNFVFKETEDTYFSDSAVYFGHFLGVLYFFKKEYLLSYSLLKGESDPVSKFYYLYALIRLGYRDNAIAAFANGSYDDVLTDSFIDSNQRLKLAFLLGIEKNLKIEFDQDNKESCALFNLMDDFHVYAHDEFVSNIIYKSNDQLIINEFNRRHRQSESVVKLITHEHCFDDGFLTLYSNSTVIGNNMYLLKISNSYVIVDCGADTKDSHIDFDSFFRNSHVDKADIAAVFFTHSHLDHIGNSLNLLNYLGNNVKYYLTIDTQNLAAYGNHVFLEGRKLRYITYNTTVQISERLSVTFVQNGHILGSTALIFHCNGKSILYTSDFCLHDQPTVKGMNLYQISSFVGDRIDYLITESTYGHKTDSIDYEDSVLLLQKLVALLIQHGKRVFFPAYAIGRTQEIFNILIDGYPNAQFNLLGSANDVTLHYVAIGRCANKHFYSDRENTNDYDITIASSGMLLENSESNLYMKKILKDSSNEIAVIQTGYLPPTQEGIKLINEWKGKGKLFYNVSLSAHASNAEIHKLIDSFRIENIISIHGDGIE